MGNVGREPEIKLIRDHFFGVLKCLVNDSIASGAFGIVVHVIVVDGQIRVVSDLNVGDFVVVDVLLVDLLADDVQSDVIFLLDHDLHLVQNELEFLSSVH